MGSPRVSGSIKLPGLEELRVLLGQFLAPGSGMTEALDGERRLMKALHGTIEGGARQARNAGDQSDASSPQLFRIDGSDQVLLMLIQMREQHVVFLLKFSTVLILTVYHGACHL